MTSTFVSVHFLPDDPAKLDIGESHSPNVRGGQPFYSIGLGDIRVYCELHQMEAIGQQLLACVSDARARHAIELAAESAASAAEAGALAQAAAKYAAHYDKFPSAA